MMKWFLAVFLSACWLGSANANADGDAQSLADAQAYLNRITTLQAAFTQIAPDGEQAQGTLYVKRAGKMRWDYAPPTPILMVSNGDTLIYYDSEMDEVSYLDLDDTLAAFIAKPNIDFDDESLMIGAVVDDADMLRFSLRHRATPDDGALVFAFQKSPMQLHQLLVENAAGDVTIITLDDVRLGMPIDDDLFTFKRPKNKAFTK